MKTKILELLLLLSRKTFIITIILSLTTGWISGQKSKAATPKICTEALEIYHEWKKSGPRYDWSIEKGGFKYYLERLKYKNELDIIKIEKRSQGIYPVSVFVFNSKDLISILNCNSEIIDFYNVYKIPNSRDLYSTIVKRDETEGIYNITQKKIVLDNVKWVTFFNDYNSGKEVVSDHFLKLFEMKNGKFKVKLSKDDKEMLYEIQAGKLKALGEYPKKKICKEALEVYQEWEKNKFNYVNSFKKNMFEYNLYRAKEGNMDIVIIDKYDAKGMVSQFVFNKNDQTPVIECNSEIFMTRIMKAKGLNGYYILTYHPGKRKTGLATISSTMFSGEIHSATYWDNIYAHDAMKKINEYGQDPFRYEELYVLKNRKFEFENYEDQRGMIFDDSIADPQKNTYKYILRSEEGNSASESSTPSYNNNISIISKSNIKNIKFNGGNYLATSIFNHTGSLLSSAPQDVTLKLYNKDGKLIKEKNSLSSDISLQDYDFPVTINLNFEQDSKLKSASFVIYNNGQISLEN